MIRHTWLVLASDPSPLCTTRVPPASTFKIPHAIAALDSGVLTGPDVVFRYDGSPQANEAWRRDHTLATAMRYSVVWYFQRIAQQLGTQKPGARHSTRNRSVRWLVGHVARGGCARRACSAAIDARRRHAGSTIPAPRRFSA